MIEHISKTTWARYFKFGMQFCMGNAERAHPLKWAWPVTWPLQFLAVRSAILATAWLLVLIN